MEENIEEKKINWKGIFNYFYNVISWTIFTLLLIIGILLLYYFISVRLYATKGDRFEPKFSVYTIVSQSMEPTISVYDVIVNAKVDNIDDVQINDVITFISTWEITNGMTITHRVVGKKIMDDGQTCLVTRGDNNTNDDQTCVKKSDLIGVTKAVIPGLGKIQFFLSSKAGLLLVVFIPALYIVIKDILKLFKLAKASDQEEQESKGLKKR
jgi:signal peptidase I